MMLQSKKKNIDLDMQNCHQICLLHGLKKMDIVK